MKAQRGRRYLVLPITLLATLPALAQEEFVGPFASWTNVHTYGATGNGVTDDSAALQSALADLGLPGHSPVLYFPPGTYAVSSRLLLSGQIHVSIVGESPDSVRIQWKGPSHASVLRLNGVAYSKISRITFDGGGKASVLVDQSWDGQKPHFDTGNEYSDDVFTGASIGIRGGDLGLGFAETSVVRSKFLSLNTGIALKNFNALDLWVWDSLFDHCGTGITNNPGAGNWHVYNSTFLYSGFADNSIGNTGGFSFIGNYSVGSRPFLAASKTFNPAWITVQANLIDSASPAPILIRNQGPLLLLDNVIGSIGSMAPGVSASSLSDTDVVSAGNRFAATTGVSVVGRVASVDDGTKQSNRFVAPALIPTPPNLNRTIFEVPAGATSDTIQAAVDDAAKLSGHRPVVHVPWGQFAGVSVTVPPTDMQVIGDGFGSELHGTVTLLGPASHVIVRDVSVFGPGVGDGIVLKGADQSGGRVFLQQVQAAYSATNIVYDGLARSTLEARDLGHMSASGTSIKVLGTGKVNIVSGASSNNASYSVSGGQLLVRDMWYEGREPAAGFLSATDGSTVTIVGSRVALPYGFKTPAFDFARFTGIAAVLANFEDDRVVISGPGTGQVLVAGVLGPNRYYFQNRSSAQAVLLNSKHVFQRSRDGQHHCFQSGQLRPGLPACCTGSSATRTSGSRSGFTSRRD